MLGFSRNAEFPKFLVKVLHVCGYARFDRAEVVVFQFLSFRGTGAEQRPARVHYILAHAADFAVDKEIFLLGPRGGNNFFNVVLSEKAQYPQCLFIDGFDGL